MTVRQSDEIQVDDALDAESAADEVTDPGAGSEAGAAVVAGRRTRRPVVAGALAGTWALLVGLAIVTCLVMLAWAISPNSVGDSAAAWNAAGMTWLAAHLVPLTVSGRLVSIWPIGGLLLGLLLTRRSGAWTGRLLPEPSGVEVAGLVAGAALVYGAGGAGVAWLADGTSASARPVQAFLWPAVVATVGTLWGVSREAGLVAAARRGLSDAAWRTLAAGLAAVVGLFAVGGVLVTISLIRGYAQVGDTLASLDAGAVGGLGVTLLGALSLPTLDVWALSVLVGPGFQVGGIGGLSAFGGQVGSLPALPVLAAIPTALPQWAPVLLVVPVLMGALAGRIRWGRDLPTATGAAAAAAALGAVVAVLLAALTLLGSGSLGGGELSHVGPAPVPVVLAGTGLVVLGFLLEAAAQSLRLSWGLHRAEQRSARERARLEHLEPPTHAVAEQPVAGDELGWDAVDVPGAEVPAGPAGWRRVSAVPGAVGSFGAAVTDRLVGVVSAGAHAVVDLRGGAATSPQEEPSGSAPAGPAGAEGDATAEAMPGAGSVEAQADPLDSGSAESAVVGPVRAEPDVVGSGTAQADALDSGSAESAVVGATRAESDVDDSGTAGMDAVHAASAESDSTRTAGQTQTAEPDR